MKNYNYELKSIRRKYNIKNIFMFRFDTDIEKIPKHLLSQDDPVFQFNKLLVDRLSNKIAG